LHTRKPFYKNRREPGEDPRLRQKLKCRPTIFNAQ